MARAMEMYARHMKPKKKQNAKKMMIDLLELSSKRQFLHNRFNVFMSRSNCLIMMRIQHLSSSQNPGWDQKLQEMSAGIRPHDPNALGKDVLQSPR